jgi:hypothetical protein
MLAKASRNKIYKAKYKIVKEFFWLIDYLVNFFSSK